MLSSSNEKQTATRLKQKTFRNVQNPAGGNRAETKTVGIKLSWLTEQALYQETGSREEGRGNWGNTADPLWSVWFVFSNWQLDGGKRAGCVPELPESELVSNVVAQFVSHDSWRGRMLSIHFDVNFRQTAD